MQRGLYDQRKNNPLKRVLANSKREVVFDAPKKRSRPSSGLDVLILTSRPNSLETRYFDQFAAVSTAQFYEKPKSQLEKQYEQNLLRFLPTFSDRDFEPLDSEGPGESGDVKTEEGAETAQESAKVSIVSTAETTAENLEKDGEVRTAKDESNSLQHVDPTPAGLFTEDMLSDLCCDKQANNSFYVAMLVKTADFFLEKAHSSVLDANDIQGTKVYYTYIKTALKALVMLARTPSKLNLQLEVLIYYNIAKIFFYETDDLRRADSYINKALALAARNNLVQMSVTCELLYCQILEVSDPKLLGSFLSEKVASYTARGMGDISDLFALLRSTHLMVEVPPTAHVALQALTKTAQPTVRILSTLYEADLQLYQGFLSTAKELLSSLNVDSQVPPIRAMYHLVMFASLIMSNHSKAKKYMNTVSDFISTERASLWPDWHEDGSVSLTLTQGSTVVPFALQGLNSDEFVIMFYFLSGILFLTERSGFRKASKVFSSCLDIIDVQLQELTQAREGSRNFSIRLLTGKIVRLNYMRYSVYYYRTWLAFMYKSDFSGVDFLVQFINNFDEENFTKEELCYYKLLMPRFLLLTAMYLQSQGDLVASKYYFLRVRDLCSSENSVPSTISYLQRGLGIGCEAMVPVGENSELYTFATLHLLIITEYEIDYSGSDKEKMARSRNYLADLYRDLSKVKPAKSAVFDLSFKVLSCIYLNRAFDKTKQDAGLVSEITAALEDCPSGTFIAILARYVLYRLSLNLDQRNELLGKCLRSISDRDDNGKMLKMFLLRESRAQNEAETELLEMKMNAMAVVIDEKLKHARTSTSAQN